MLKNKTSIKCTTFFFSIDLILAATLLPLESSVAQSLRDMRTRDLTAVYLSGRHVKPTNSPPSVGRNHTALHDLFTLPY